MIYIITNLLPCFAIGVVYTSDHTFYLSIYIRLIYICFIIIVLIHDLKNIFSLISNLI